MRANFFEYQPEFKLIFSGNHKPALHNVDAAMKRRIIIVPFTQTPDNPDPNLEEKLRAEWPYILQWMIVGCLDWQQNGLLRAQSVIDATDEYFEDQDPIGKWLKAECIVEPGNKHKWETSANLFKSWAQFAKEEGVPIGTQKAPAKNLRRQGLSNTSKYLAGAPHRVWIGANIKSS